MSHFLIENRWDNESFNNTKPRRDLKMQKENDIVIIISTLSLQA